MEINEKKLARQLIGVDRWVHSTKYGAPYNGCGTLYYYVAVGKTYTSLIICNRMFSKNPAATVVVIVPSEAIQKQWKKEIKLHVPEIYWHNIDIYTINYLVENKIRTNVDLLIPDEIHEYLTDERLPYINKTQINYRFILGLTATWEDKNHREKALKDICPVIDTITEQEALREGFISKYIEFNLACTLTSQEKLEYKGHSDIIARCLPKFGNILDVAQKCLSGGIHINGNYYKGYQFANGWARRNGWYPNGDLNDTEYENLDDLWNPNKVIGYAKSLMNAIRDRKDILYNTTNKALKVNEIVQKFNTLKTICFSQSTLFADKVGKIINTATPGICVVYHSKLATITRIDDGQKVKKIGKVRLKREAIESIVSGSARVISTASALDRGFNVEDIRLSIAASGTQNPTQHIQRGGRVKRLEMYAPDTVVLIVNLYVPETVDEKWLRNRQKKSKNMVYWIESVDEITYNPIDKSVFSATLI